MNPTVVCPLPELADALQPYIRSREEVANARRVIDLALSEHRGGSDRTITRFSSLDREGVPQTIDHDGFDGSGIRSAYLKALIARQSAQKRFDALKAEIAQQHAPIGLPETGESDIHVDGTLNAITAIRREQRQRKLHIIQRGIDDLETQRDQSQYGNIDKTLSNDTQKLPSPPSKPRLEDGSWKGVASEIARLKKAVLQAQTLSNSNAEPLNEEIQFMDDTTRISNGKITALNQTRDTVVMWLEKELAKIPEHSAHVSPVDRLTDGSADGPSVSEQDVRSAYQSYLEARRSLVGTTEAAKGKAAESVPVSNRNEVAAPSSRRVQQPDVFVTADVLPYAADLCAITEEEAALMQEATFVRRQIAWAGEKNRQLVHRLADESHLVAPGAADVRAWVQAGREARVDDGRVIQSKLTAGENSFRRASEAV